ncbi:MAG TPA: sulfotransferase [Candidatus Limnocylindrales bacterium]|nr:sulfotransferase [Candidatus Limnocylindrales bacterium]
MTSGRDALPGPIEAAPAVPSSPSHVFIVGCARTGSTLLRHLLNRHPRVAIASETHFFKLARRLGLEARLRAARPGDRAAIERVARDLYRPEGWPWLARNVPPAELTDRLAAGEPTLRRLFTVLLELYAARERPGETGPILLGEKTPEHLAMVPTLAEWFPRARFVHTFRDPRAIHASELRRRRGGHWGPKARLPRAAGRLVDPLLGPLELVRTSLAWRDAAERDARYRRTLGERYLLVRFEDLVAQPEAAVRDVCGFLGLDWTPSILEGVDVVGSSFAASRHTGRGIDPTAAERWRTLDPLTRAWYSLAFRGRLTRFGYRP